MIKLCLYLFIIVLPFLPISKKYIKFTTMGRKKTIELKKGYWICVAMIMSIISMSTKTYTDIDIYTNIFDWTNAGSTNYDTLGWSLLCRLFYYLGFNYRGMILFVLVTAVFIISRACRKICISEDKVLSLMLIFPGLMNIIQLKFFLAMSIIIYSITFLQKSEGKMHFIKYILGIFLATLIHSASIFCIIYLLAVVFEKVDIEKSFFYTVAGIICLSIFLRFIPVVASKFLSSQVILRYFTGAVEVSSANWIIEITIAWFLMVVIAWLAIKTNNAMIKGSKNNVQFIDGGRSFVSRNFTIICLSGIALPLLIFDQNFHRFIEIEYMVGYIFYIYYEKNTKNDNYINKYTLNFFLIIAIVYCMRYFVIFDRILPLLSWDGLVILRR